MKKVIGSAIALVFGLTLFVGQSFAGETAVLNGNVSSSQLNSGSTAQAEPVLKEIYEPAIVSGLKTDKSSNILRSNPNVDDVYKKLKGWWADESWYRTLEETKSAQKACGKNGGYVSHILFREAKMDEYRKEDFSSSPYVIDFAINCFHEGLHSVFNKCKTENVNGKLIYKLYEIPDGYEDMPDNYCAEVSIVKNNVIDVVSKADYRESISVNKFIKLKGTVDEFVNEIIVEGKYSDSNNKYYIFEKDGKMDWNGKRKFYKIGIDYVAPSEEPKKDYIRIKEESENNYTESYSFEIVNGKLVLIGKSEKIILTKQK